MNKLLINGLPVIAHYAPFKPEGGGSILQLFIQSPELHILISESLYERLKQEKGVMDNKYLEIRHEKFPDTEFSEIRLLVKRLLWVVDHLRSEGFSVIEEDVY